MKGASLRSVGELLGYRGLRMVLRYAHLSPAYLSAEVGRLDATLPTLPPPPPSTERAKKATYPERQSGSGESGEISEGKWLLRLDSFFLAARRCRAAE
jgi:hypothetical protein